VWAGNSGTQPSPGNGTCGSAGLNHQGTIGAYSNSYVYTHLGQLWQGPTSGGSTQYQYLYCTSSAPHQLTGLYGLGATCANKGTATYTSGYDPYGNVTGRTCSGTTGALSYNNLNQLVEWNAASNNQEWYIYDAAGNRVLRRSTNSNGTTMMVYAFGREEHQYSGTGTNQANTSYYFLGSQLIGDMDANGTYFLLTDALGSVLSEINWAAGGASINSNQPVEAEKKP
jgi:YD repeat-containing protein